MARGCRNGMNLLSLDRSLYGPMKKIAALVSEKYGLLVILARVCLNIHLRFWSYYKYYAIFIKIGR